MIEQFNISRNVNVDICGYYIVGSIVFLNYILKLST